MAGRRPFPPFIIYFACVCICVCGGCNEWKSADSWESSLAFHQVGSRREFGANTFLCCSPVLSLWAKRKTLSPWPLKGALHSPPGPRSPTLDPLCAAQGGATGVKPYDPNRSVLPLPLPQALGSGPLQAPPIRGSAPSQLAPHTQV